MDIGPFPSWEEQYSLIKSSVEQKMTICYQAKDINGAESEWTYVDVTITKSKAFTESFLILSILKNMFPRLSNIF
jgi:hypothetical protein